MTFPRPLMLFLIAAGVSAGAVAQAAPVEPGDMIRMVLYRTEGGGAVSSAQVIAVVKTMRNENDCLAVRIDATRASRAELADVVGTARPEVMTSLRIPVSEGFFIEVREDQGDRLTRVESVELKSAGVECIEGES